jgi:hypothetical protein
MYLPEFRERFMNDQMSSNMTGNAALPDVGPDEIAGIVNSDSGLEAGVWVIAETHDTLTPLRKIVVTDDYGRYLVPELPKGTYKVWVRGYGLVDSEPVKADPGVQLNLNAEIAPTPQAAAKYYPASYWASLLEVPPESAFPMQSGCKSQTEWIQLFLFANMHLTQFGDQATRNIPQVLGVTDHEEAWRRAIVEGVQPVTLEMTEWWSATRTPFEITPDGETTLKMLADWSRRIAEGEVPPPPPRPTGIERNVVLTLWDWGDDKAWMHEAAVSDWRDPTVNANGPVYGVYECDDKIQILDPVAHTSRSIPWPIKDPTMPLIAHSKPVEATSTFPCRNFQAQVPFFWGDEFVRTGRAFKHDPMIDHKGRVWVSGQFRKGEDLPDFCKPGSGHPSTEYFQLTHYSMFGGLSMQLGVYDPKTEKWEQIDTGFIGEHFRFANDENDTVFVQTVGGDAVLGWVNTKLWDETKDAAKSQGWCPFVLDTNGDGQIEPGWTEPGEKFDPTKDTRVSGFGRTLDINPIDGSVWVALIDGPTSGFILRVELGSNPPHTCKTERYNPPKLGLGEPTRPHSVDIDSNGLVWVTFSESGHIASFDRSKCKVLNGPTATGDHCPEAWTVYRIPGPRFKGAESFHNTADSLYAGFVDRFNMGGLGQDVPLVTGSNSDSLMALLPGEQELAVLRVPYPMGFYSRGIHGRIDDPSTGWKGRGLWAIYSSICPWNYEGGKGATPKVVKFQVRPDPLAR